MRPLDVSFTKKINHFENFILPKKEYKRVQKVHNFFDKYKNKNCLIITYSSMLYRLRNNQKITYFDIPSKGNFGFNGNKKMIDKIKEMHDYYFIISLSDYNSKYEYSQFSRGIVKFIVDNYEKIDEKYDFVVFYKY